MSRIGTILAGFWIGVAIGVAAEHREVTNTLPVESGAAEPYHLLGDENQIVVSPLKPMTVELAILPNKEFKARAPVGSTGFAYIGRQNSRCRIFISESSGLLTGSLLGHNQYGLYPASADPELAHLLSHELLHCMVGEWHPK
jgi:hypothetical protein